MKNHEELLSETATKQEAEKFIANTPNDNIDDEVNNERITNKDLDQTPNLIDDRNDVANVANEESINETEFREGEPDQQHEGELYVRDVVQDCRCGSYDQAFRSKKSLKKHMIKKRSPIGKYVCKICERAVRRSKTSRLHISQDHENKDERHKMEITGDHEENEDSENQTEDLETQNEDENKSTEFPLEAPRYAGHQTDEISENVKPKVEEHKKVKCISCGRNFVSQDRLTIHMETHNAKQRSKLEDHMKKHTKPKDEVKVKIK